MPPTDLSRRAFLRGEKPKYTSTAIHPPWTVEVSQFIENCTRCDECIKACPEKILFRGDGGYPEVDFKRGECTFCGKCADACEADVFQSGQLDENNAWSLQVSIAVSCLSLNAIVCRSCGDHCDTDAIRFRLQTGGVSIPEISLDKCTGCGACLYVCPNNSVSISRSTDMTDHT